MTRLARTIVVGPVRAVVAVALLAASLLAPASSASAREAAATVEAGSVAGPRRAPAQEADEATLKFVYQDLEVGPNDAFTALLEVHDAPPGGHLAVDLYDRITHDEALGRAMLGTPITKLATFPVIELEPNAMKTQPAGLTIQLREPGSERRGEPGWSWVLEEPGVYPVGIRIRDADGAEISSTITYLVRLPAEGQHLRHLDLGLLVSVPAPQVPDAPTPTETVEGLIELVYTMSSHPEVPVSFDIEAAAEQLFGDASLETILGDVIAGDDRELLTGTRVPIDIAMLVGNGLDGDVTEQIRLGSADRAGAFGIQPEPIVAVDRPLDEAAARALSEAGITGVVAASGAIGSGPPGAPAAIAGVEGLSVVSDGLLDLARSDIDIDDPVLAANRLIAQGLAWSSLADGADGQAEGDGEAERPDAATVVSIDPATTDIEVVDALLDLLSEPAQAWTAKTVGGLLETGERSGPLALPELEEAEMSDYLSARADLTELAASYRTMLEDPGPHDDRLRDLFAASVDVRLTDDEQVGSITAAEAALHETFASISTAETERVTLGARDAEIPLRVLSTADEPLRVRVELRSSERLQFPREELVVTLQPDGPTVVRVPVHTRATGDTPMTVTLTSPDGSVRLSETRYTVRSTAVSGMGVVLTIGAASFLVVWWGRHILRARREVDAKNL